MNEEFIQSKKIFIDQMQKQINRQCFERCFDSKSAFLDRECFVVCYQKYTDTFYTVFEHLKDVAYANKTIYHFKLFFNKNPFAKVTFDPMGIVYKLGMPSYVYGREYWGKKSF